MGERRKLARRAFLAGIGGAAVSLPFLDAMRGGRAEAQGPVLPKRLVLGFGGLSMGSDRDRDVSRMLPTPNGSGGFDFPRALAPLAAVQERLTVVSGLRIPVGGAASRQGSFHSSSIPPLISGHRDESGNPDNPRSAGPSADEVVADHLRGDARFRNLVYRAQPQGYRANSGKGWTSYRRDSSGTVSPNDPITSPKLAFDQLFSDFMPPSAGEPTIDPAQTRRAAIVDLVYRRSERLRDRLGRADRLRLEAHFDQIAELQRRIGGIAENPLPSVESCVPPADPGEDPETELGERDDGVRTGYSQEEERCRVLTDLTHMALTCDLTRVVSLQYTYAQCFMDTRHVIPSGVNSDMHQLGHFGGTTEDHDDSIAWHLEHWSRLVQLLRDTPEGDGNLLDHTVLVMLFEGGGGDDGAHSTEDMVAFIAGGEGLGISHRGHLDGSGAHPAQVTLRALRALGHEGPLGELTEPFSLG